MNFKGKFNGEAFDVGNGKEISLNQIKNIVDKYQKKSNWVFWNNSESRVLVRYQKIHLLVLKLLSLKNFSYIP